MLALICASGRGILKQLCSLSSPYQELRAGACASLEIDPSTCIAVGFHGDGVPHQKNQTIIVCSWNCISMPSAERFLFTAIPKRFCCACGCRGRHSLDAISNIFRWCMCILTIGLYPTVRHDRSPWTARDRSRSEKHGGDLGFNGVLMQARGDWAWFRELFGFPSWSSNRICWRCRADRSVRPFTDFSSTALWRSSRISPTEFFAEQAAQGIPINPLFSCPGFQLSWVCIDMLHCCDLGVSQKILGNLFFEALAVVCGRGSRAKQVEELWKFIGRYYKRALPSSKLDNLTPEMVKQPKKGPKLRCKGGECRGLVAFGLELADMMVEADRCEKHLTMLRMMSALLGFYELVSQGDYPAEVAADLCRECCLHYSGLSAMAVARFGPETKHWTVTPKFHMMQEMAESQSLEIGSPRDFWCYKDEDFVGFISTMAFSRGGACTAKGVTQRLVDRYRSWLDSV